MAKYDSLRKTDRNKMLIDFAKSHGNLSQEEIGKQFNISGSRVSRILNGNRKALTKVK
ncbi:MAG: sigma factor-like helix-turn-helix DNA-binding protein [Dehalococcoidales bacterium]|nr:sigma factor-like helix-turn-helix DNA-binding protein [Dehalococcoidales bacterium]